MQLANCTMKFNKKIFADDEKKQKKTEWVGTAEAEEEARCFC